MRSLWIILGAVAGAGLTSEGYFLRSRHSSGIAQADSSIVKVVEAKCGTISETILASGNICSNGDWVIDCHQACGEVVRLPFAVGDRVKKGDVVCGLDPAIEQNAVDQAQESLCESQRKLEETQKSANQAIADLELSIRQADESIGSLRVKATNMVNKASRQKSLLSQSLTSQEDYETTETDAATAETEYHNAELTKQQLENRREMQQTENIMNVELAEAAVKSAQTALKNTQSRLSSTTMLSPTDGVVAELKTEMTSWIVPGGDFGHQAVMTISDLSRIFVNVSISERQIGSIQTGQSVAINTDSYPGKQFAGVVTQIAPTGVNNGKLVVFQVKIEVTSPDKALLKPPMSANVQIIKQTKDKALLVPTQAVEQSDNKPFVTVVSKNGGQQSRPVSLGISDGARDEILGGLNAGERVLVRAGHSGIALAQSAAD